MPIKSQSASNLTQFESKKIVGSEIDFIVRFQFGEGQELDLIKILVLWPDCESDSDLIPTRTQPNMTWINGPHKTRDAAVQGFGQIVEDWFGRDWRFDLNRSCSQIANCQFARSWDVIRPEFDKISSNNFKTFQTFVGINIGA